jgi:hypothetical protein
MFKNWDSDRTLLFALLAAALISLSVNYKDALANTADRFVQTFKEHLGPLKAPSPSEDPKPSRALRGADAVDSRGDFCTDAGFSQKLCPTRIIVVDRRCSSRVVGCGRVIDRCPRLDRDFSDNEVNRRGAACRYGINPGDRCAIDKATCGRCLHSRD